MRTSQINGKQNLEKYLEQEDITNIKYLTFLRNPQKGLECYNTIRYTTKPVSQSADQHGDFSACSRADKKHHRGIEHFCRIKILIHHYSLRKLCDEDTTTETIQRLEGEFATWSTEGCLLHCYNTSSLIDPEKSYTCFQSLYFPPNCLVDGDSRAY
jgi:hypothetical protein